MNRLRLTAVAGLLVAAVPAKAHATFWDFLALTPGAPVAPSAGPAGATVFASPKTVTNGALGSVTFTSNNANSILFKWRPTNSTTVGVEDEKGVAPCATNPAGGIVGGCDEVGPPPSTDWLILNVAGLAPGSALLSVRIASLSVGESYNFDLCPTGTANGSNVGCTTYTGPGLQPNVFDVPVVQGANTLVRFKVGTGDYIVQGITTTVPEPATMGLLATGLVALAGAGKLRRRNRNK